MAGEARLEQVGNGLTPVGEGWFVLNARDASWLQRDGAGGRLAKFELDGRTAAGTDHEPVMFEQVGCALEVLAPASRAACTTAGAVGRDS